MVTITHDHAARRRSYELIAQAFSLAGGSGDVAARAAAVDLAASAPLRPEDPAPARSVGRGFRRDPRRVSRRRRSGSRRTEEGWDGKRGVHRTEVRDAHDRGPRADRGGQASPTRPRSAPSATVNGSDSSFAEMGTVVEEIAARPDRSGHRARRTRRHPGQHPPGVDAGRAWPSRPREAWWCRSIRPTRPRSASGCSATPSAAAVVCEDESQLAKVDEGARPASRRCDTRSASSAAAGT